MGVGFPRRRCASRPLIRWAIGGLVHDRIPFTTYYPAIVAATLLGGFWRGALACILSAVLAWWLFMSPAFGFALDQGQLVSLITFILVCLLLVGTVTALNAAVDLLLVEIDFRRGAQIALGQLALWQRLRRMPSSPAGTRVLKEYSVMKPMR